MGFPLSSKSPIKASPTKPTSSSGSDENDYGMGRNPNPNSQIGSRIQNRNRPTAMKHFMAPTVSATSKAVTPTKKKVLAERNSEASSGFAFSDAHIQRSPDLDLEFKFKQLGIRDSIRSSTQVSPFLSPSRISGSGDEEEGISFVPDSSTRPYDPLTNYLSPRPKFLRYNPNRRMEMIHRHEDESEEGTDGLIGPSTSDSSVAMKCEDDDGSSVCCSGSCDDSPSLERWLEKQNEGSHDEAGDDGGDDEAEEEEEEEEEEEVMEGIEEEGRCLGLKGVLKFLLVLVLVVLSSAYISSMNSPTPPPALVFLRSLKDEYLKMEDRVYPAISVKRFHGESDYLHDDTKEFQMDGFDVTEKNVTRKAEVKSVHIGDMEKNEMEGACEQGSADREMSDDNVFGKIELQETQISEIIESMEDYQIVTIFDLINDHEARLHSTKSYGIRDDIDLPILAKQSTCQGAEAAEVTSLEEANIGESSEMDEVSNIEVGKMRQPSTEESKIEDEAIELPIDVEKMEEPPIDDEKMEERPKDVERMEELTVKQVQSWLIPENVIWAAIFTLGVVVSLLVRFYSKSKRDAAAKSSLLNVEPCSKAEMPRKNSSVFPTTETINIEKIDYIVNPASSSSLLIEDKRVKEATLRRGAPKVELLGEFVFGEVTTSSLKSSTVRNIMTESSGEESVHSISQARRDDDYSSSTCFQASQSEVSTTSAPSHGSFTAEEMIDGKGGEEAKVVSTPVRRSSRIRNRGVKSP